MHQDTKILSMGQLLDVRLRAKQQGQTVVHCHGCFDIVHPGHVHYLEYARSLGDMLIVSVSSDQNVAKGPARPLIPDDLRMRSLAALQCVDAVYLSTKPTAEQLLDQLRPDIYVKGREYETSSDPRFHRERDTVIANGGKVVFSGGEVVYSSTAIIDSMSSTGLFDQEKIRRYRDRHGLSNQFLHHTIQQFRGKKIAIVGDYILDRYHFCESIGVASESPSTLSLRTIRHADYDGGAGVIAMHAAAMGARPTLFTTMAQDDAGDIAKRRLSNAGVRVVSAGERRSTVTKERFLVEEHKAFRVESGTAWACDSTVSQTLAHAIVDHGDFDALLFADFGYSTISTALAATVIDEMKSRVGVMAADVSGSQGSLKKFKGVQLVTPTEREAREAVGDHRGGVGAVAGTLLHELHIRQAIFTLGKQGLLTFDTDPSVAIQKDRLASEYLPALSGRGIDPLGCGDALLTAATLALACGASLATAAYVGSLAAAIEVSLVGNIPVSDDALYDIVGRESVRLAS
jgi:rfaE bifunctional protein kinase chain/domain/rfaE bifunctional protein nucleotidyltransferase chain/domain